MPDGGVVGEPHDLLHEPFTAVVGRVRLAGDDDLHRTVRVEQDRPQPRRVAQHQGQPLVGRRPAGRNRWSGCPGPGSTRSSPVRPPSRRAAAASCGPWPWPSRPAAGATCSAAPRAVSEDTLSAAGHSGADARSCQSAMSAARSYISRAAQVGRCTPLVTDPIGTSSGVEARVQRREHVPRHRAVQLGHPVRPLGEPQPHVRHVEPARVVLGTQRDDLVDDQAGQQPGHARRRRRPGSAAPDPPGSGRYRPAPGCAW